MSELWDLSNIDIYHTLRESNEIYQFGAKAAMCLGEVAGKPSSDREIIKMAADIMEPRNESVYAKGLNAYDAWKEMRQNTLAKQKAIRAGK